MFCLFNRKLCVICKEPRSRRSKNRHPLVCSRCRTASRKSRKHVTVEIHHYHHDDISPQLVPGHDKDWGYSKHFELPESNITTPGTPYAYCLPEPTPYYE
ncbi:hypothetical protein DM02DRAFT_620304, partial [Periconia macrospinosa]